MLLTMFLALTLTYNPALNWYRKHFHVEAVLIRISTASWMCPGEGSCPRGGGVRVGNVRLPTTHVRHDSVSSVVNVRCSISSLLFVAEPSRVAWPRTLSLISNILSTLFVVRRNDDDDDDDNNNDNNQHASAGNSTAPVYASLPALSVKDQRQISSKCNHHHHHNQTKYLEWPK